MKHAEHILAVVVALFDLDLDELRGRRRWARLAPARLAAAYALRQQGVSVMECGELLGRDHSTVIQNAQHAIARASVDPMFAAQLRALDAALNLPPELEPPATPRHKPQPTMITAPLRLALHFWGVSQPTSA